MTDDARADAMTELGRILTAPDDPPRLPSPADRPLRDVDRPIAFAETNLENALAAGPLDRLVAQTPDDLARLLVAVDDVRARADALRKRVVQALVTVTPGSRYAVDGVGVLERRSGTTRKNWDDRAVAAAVARVAADRRVDPETGEVRQSEADAVVEALIACAGVDYWRVTRLREYGIDAGRYCEEIPGVPTVTLTRSTR